MKRKLLNIIFSKYPNLGNFEKLINLNYLDLISIANASDLESARTIFSEILTEKELPKNEDEISKSKSLENKPVFYINL